MPANEILHRVVGGLLYEGVILGTRPNFCSVTEAAMGDELRLSAIERRT